MYPPPIHLPSCTKKNCCNGCFWHHVCSDHIKCEAAAGTNSKFFLMGNKEKSPGPHWKKDREVGPGKSDATICDINFHKL